MSTSSHEIPSLQNEKCFIGIKSLYANKHPFFRWFLYWKSVLWVIPVLLLSAFLLIWPTLLFLDFIEAQKSEDWPSVAGVITSSRVRNMCHSSRSNSYYRADVRYYFIVNGITYYGNQIGFGDGCVNENEANARIAPYPVGTAITVYVNPLDVNQAVLIKGKLIAADRWTWALAFIFIACSFIALLFSIFFTFFEIRKIRRCLGRAKKLKKVA